MVRKLKSDITTELGKIESGVIRTLLYFDIFSYPLTQKEILDFLPYQIEEHELQSVLDFLIQEKLIYALDEFYLLRADEKLVSRRLAGNKLATKRLRTAKFFGKLISNFPYVRAVMLSGSISKNYMDSESDIDYFVVTAPGKLWLTRGLLAIFKRVFLLNSHKFFCTNYFIDTNSLEIEEKNIYTAVEISTLIPVSGDDVYQKFIEHNNWIKNLLPNHQPVLGVGHNTSNSFQNLVERMFSNRLGSSINTLFYKAAIKRWESKYQNQFAPEDFNVAFKSRINISKNHPRFFQKKTLDGYSSRIRQFENSNKLNLSI